MNKGKIVQVMGPVVDVVFEDGVFHQQCDYIAPLHYPEQANL